MCSKVGEATKKLNRLIRQGLLKEMDPKENQGGEATADAENEDVFGEDAGAGDDNVVEAGVESNVGAAE